MSAQVPPWALPPVQMVPTQTPELAYHRLYRGAPAYRWWKPLLVLLLSAVYTVLFSVIVTLAVLPLLQIFDQLTMQKLLSGDAAGLLDTQRPWSVVLTFLSIIVMIPAVQLAMLSARVRPIGRVWSVAGRIRWRLLLSTFGASLLLVVGVNMLINWLLSLGGAAELPEAIGNFDVRAAWISAVLVLLLVPLQVTAEEMVFRGLLMQVLGAWMRRPWLSIVLSALIFALMHIYDIWGLLAVGMMGLVTAWLSYRTGGLEVAIALHLANNYFAFTVLLTGVTGETAQTASPGGPELLIGEAVTLVLVALVTLRIWRRQGHGRTRIDTVLREVPLSAEPLRAAGAENSPPATDSASA